jgi:hypothetical protein
MDKNTIEDNVGPYDIQTFQVKIINIRLIESGKEYPYPYIVETYDNIQCVVKETEIIRKLTLYFVVCFFNLYSLISAYI